MAAILSLDKFRSWLATSRIFATNNVRKIEKNPVQRGHVKDIGSTVGETFLSLSPILGGDDNKLGSASD
jgi:hypothetical protein